MPALFNHGCGDRGLLIIGLTQTRDITQLVWLQDWRMGELMLALLILTDFVAGNSRSDEFTLQVETQSDLVYGSWQPYCTRTPQQMGTDKLQEGFTKEENIGRVLAKLYGDFCMNYMCIIIS